MACPTQCTCGKNIGELHSAFRDLYEAHVDLYMKKSKVHPLKQSLVDGEIPGIVYIFDFLGLDSMCCRNKIKNFRDTDRINYRYVSFVDPVEKKEA